jgi:hypothetical protein
VAGYKGLIDCERLEVIPVAPAEKPECTEPDPDRICFYAFGISVPVVCDGYQYENRCVASGAGYSDSVCEPLGVVQWIRILSRSLKIAPAVV